MNPRLFGAAALVVSVAALAQPADFDAANKSLQEQSYSRACDGFTAFLKTNPTGDVAREATAKRIAACANVGKASWSELQKFASEGEKDFARAYASAVLALQGYHGFATALPLLVQASSGFGRQATEAKALLVTGALAEQQRNSYNRQQSEAMAVVVLQHATRPADKATARYWRAVSRLNDQKTISDGEVELRELGYGDSDWADDALYMLGNRRESEQKYLAALELYDLAVKRFGKSPTSNMASSAASQAAQIRRKSVSVTVYNFGLPGQKPTVQLSWRNVTNASFKLKRLDPSTVDNMSDGLLSDSFLQGGSTVSTWSTKLEVPVMHAPGSKQFDLEVTEAGVYALEAAAEGEVSRTPVLITQTATLTKTDKNTVMVWVADVETGVAQANAEVLVWQRGEGQSGWRRTTGKTDAQGLATFPAEKHHDTVYVWTRSGAHWSLAQAGNWYESSYSRQELAYVLVDRPLFKPGETAGLKVFIRSRELGPTEPIANREVQLTVSDPTGKTVAEPKLTTNAFGTGSVTVPIAKNATLGAWRVTVRSPTNNIYYQQLQYGFRVEEYKPPESSVSVEPVGNPKPGEVVKFKVKATYFSGGPVANAQGRAIVRVTQWGHQWGPWPDEKNDEGDESADDGDDYGGRGRYGRRGYYRPYYGAVAQHTVVFKTGADGTAEVEVPKTDNGVGQALQYAAEVLVTDSSRREIQGAGSVKVSPDAFFVDVRSGHYLYKPGERVSLQLRGEDPNGRPADPEVIVRLMRVSEDGRATRIVETRTKLVKGRGAVMLDADALGQVRAEVVDATVAPENAPVLAQTDLWLTNDAKPMVPPAVGFQVYVDRAPLKVGQAMRALVVAPRTGGHVLLALENDALHGTKVVELLGRARYVELPMTAELAPNGFLFASRFESGQFHQFMAPLRVSGSEVDLGVSVSFGRPVVEPGSQVSVTVTAKKGPANTPLETALTIVDEALFAIEKARTDFGAFFARHQRQHTVRTMTTMNVRSFAPRQEPRKVQAQTEVLGNVAQNKENKLLMGAKAEEASPKPSAAPAPAVAGLAMADSAPAEKTRSVEREAGGKRSAKKDVGRDEDDSGAANGSNEDPVKVRTDFGSSSGWFAALKGSAGAPFTQMTKLTDSLTSWKAIATVVSAGPHFGQGSASIRTAKPLMVRLQAPRFFIENDEVVLSAVVESHLPASNDVEVSITAPGFKALTAAKKTLRVDAEQVVRFDARFKVSELGDRTVRATVRGGGTSDAMEWKLPALVHGSAQRQFFAGRLGDSFKVEFDVPEKRKPSLTKFDLVLSPSLLSVMFDGLPYLAQYPYGCVEQTLSRFVPAVIARRAVKDLNLPVERVPADLDDMVQKGLERLAMFQHGDGGWGWWQTDTTNKWMTAYVVYALSLAKEAGVPVDEGSLERGRSYLHGHLGEALNDAETHVFMVFALSATGKVPKPVMDQVFARRTGYSQKGRSLAALALLNVKDPRARIAVENLDDIVKAAQARNDASVGEANDAWSTSAAIEATAFALMAMVKYDLKSPLIGPLTDFLVLRRNGGKWRTTRDTAFAIYALSELAKREGASLKSGSFVVFVNGKEVKRLPFSRGGLDLAPIVLGDAALKAGRNVVEVRRDASGTGYFAATIDVFNQNDFIKGVGGDVTVKRTYTLLGKPSAEKGSAPTEYGMPVESGVRVRVDVEVSANKAVEFVMVEDLKPAGFEAVLTRSGPEVCNYACAHAELRNDRVAMFLPRIPVGTTKVSYELRAEVPGKFAALPARVEAMYAPEIQATADEMRFEVRDTPTTGVAAQ